LTQRIKEKVLKVLQLEQNQNNHLNQQANNRRKHQIHLAVVLAEIL